MSPAEDLELVVGRLDGEVEGIHKELKRLNRMLFGNGRQGIAEHLTRLDERVGQMSADLVDAHEALRGAVERIEEAAQAIHGHANDPCHTPEGMLLQRRVLTPAILLMIGLSLAQGMIESWLLAHGDEAVKILLKFLGL